MAKLTMVIDGEQVTVKTENGDVGIAIHSEGKPEGDLLWFDSDEFATLATMIDMAAQLGRLNK